MKSAPNRNKLRNLSQYKDLTDEEFDLAYEALVDKKLSKPDLDLFNERVDFILDKFGEDYDLVDMKSNDMVQLKTLARAMVTLEDIEVSIYERSSTTESISNDTIVVLEKLNGIASKLRTDISKISEDLQLTRKIRKQSKEVGVLDYIQKLRERAREFHKQRMLYIFCPKCKFLLANVWLLYPDNDNELTLTCGHCDNKFTTNLSGLYETGNKNLEDVEIP